jgi:spore coat protein CotH
MNWKIIFLCFLPFSIFGQTLYNPQVLYESPGGLFDKDSLRSIYVDFQDSNYHSILVDAFFTDPSYRIPATLTLNGISYDSVGVRYKGNSTFCLPNDNSNPKVPYNLDFNYWIAGQKLVGKKKVKLANAWMDPTFVKEFSASQIYKNYLPTPEINLNKLYVQGNYLGLYVNTESINKQFVKKHFDEKSGVLFKCDPSGMFCDTVGSPASGEPNLKWLGEDSTSYYNSYTIKSDNGWEELMDLIKAINLTPQDIDSILNVDRTLWAFAVNQVVSNLDTYNGYYIHNYYLYQTKDGLFNMIPWDLSESFVGAIMGFSYFNPSSVYEYNPYFGENSSDGRPLTELLFSNSQYRKQYTAHMRTVINESLDTADVRMKINNLQSLVSNAASTDVNKGFNMNDYYNNVESSIFTSWGFGGIMSTIDARKQYLLSHPEISLTPPLVSSVNVSNNLLTTSVFNASVVELMATTSQYNSKFQSFIMNDDGINGDVNANDGVYSIVMPFVGNTNVKFYIRSQNNDAMMLSPERAEYEFYEYSTISGIIDSPTSINKKLIKVCDVLGREVNIDFNATLFFIYDDGTVEKKIIVE